MKVGIRTMFLFSVSAVVAGMQRPKPPLLMDWDWNTAPALLVIAADHGEGTSALSHALGEHPCLISVGEPFDTSSQRWSSPTGESAFFAYNGSKGEASDYTKLQEHLDEAMTLKGWKTFNLTKDLHRKYPKVLDFFKAVRAEVCQHVAMPSMCGSRCVLVHKLFPSWFTYNFSYVKDYLESEETMVLQVIRNESAVIQSNQERFNMGDGAIDGLRAWNSFLHATHTEIPWTKIWMDISMDDEMFQSPEYYLEQVTTLLPRFLLPFDDKVLKRLYAKIQLEFRLYAARKQRLQEGNVSRTIYGIVD